MFIELLIAMGILGMLSAITIVAVNPLKHLCDVQNARRLVTARELTNAVNQYAIATFREASADIPRGERNARPVCRQGVAGNAACVSLDALVPDYLHALPTDPAESDPALAGYRIFRNESSADLASVAPAHLEDCHSLT